MKRKNFGRSAICDAGYPDSAATGYPGAYQWYDAQKKLWRWDFVGSASGSKSKEAVQRQAAHARQVRIGGRYRYVFVERWIRVKKPRKGWRAVIRYVVEVKKERRTCHRCPAK